MADIVPTSQQLQQKVSVSLPKSFNKGPELSSTGSHYAACSSWNQALGLRGRVRPGSQVLPSSPGACACSQLPGTLGTESGELWFPQEHQRSGSQGVWGSLQARCCYKQPYCQCNTIKLYFSLPLVAGVGLYFLRHTRTQAGAGIVLLNAKLPRTFSRWAGE